MLTRGVALSTVSLLTKQVFGRNCDQSMLIVPLRRCLHSRRSTLLGPGHLRVFSQSRNCSAALARTLSAWHVHGASLWQSTMGSRMLPVLAPAQYGYCRYLSSGTGVEKADEHDHERTERIASMRRNTYWGAAVLTLSLLSGALVVILSYGKAYNTYV